MTDTDSGGARRTGGGPPGSDSTPESSAPDAHRFIARVEEDPRKESAFEFHMLTRIDEATWEGITHALDLLGKLYRGFNIHLRIAYDDLAEELQTAHTELLATSHLDETTMMRLINRALHVSVALRLYEEHAMSEIHRKWGARSEQADAAKKLFSAAFDQSFGYRVLHALRNALVHTAEELITCAFSSWLDEPSKDVSTTSARVTLGLSRSAFAGTDVRAGTRREVSSLTEDPDVLTLSGEALAQVELLNSALEPYLYPDIDDAVMLVWQASRAHFPTASQAPWFMTVDNKATPTTVMPVRPVFWDYIVRRASAAEATQAASSRAE